MSSPPSPVSCVSGSIRHPAEIEEFELQGVKATGRTLGSGSYGSVVEVQYCHVFCAAKKLHEDLISPEDDGHKTIIDKYIQECRLMSRLRHPNITQFLGVCFLSKGQTLPHLVMEKLEASLHSLLESVPRLPLSVRVSWLEGVCYGLNYLHSRTPAVIHRDLTASNVLLTSSLVAKITDVGNSRIIELAPGQVATFTKQPGTVVYMPPEALNETHRYGPQIDVFSFGHLALFTFTQVFPWELKSATYSDPEDSEIIMGRSEIERRAKYMEKLMKEIQPSYPGLVNMVTDCLKNTSDERPSLEALIQILVDVKIEIEILHGREKIDINNILAQKKIAMQEKTIQQLKTRSEEQQNLLKEKDKHISHTTEEQNKKNKVLAKTCSELQTNLKLLQLKEDELQLKNDQLDRTLTELRLKEVELQRILLEESLEAVQPTIELSEEKLKETIQNLSEQLDKCRKLFRLSKGVQDGDTPLDLDWRAGPAMPRPMAGYIQTAMLGDEIFVGGGCTNTGCKFNSEIMVYSTLSQRWLHSLTYSLAHFGLTVIHHQLVVVGGNDGESSTGVLGVWDAGKKAWTRLYESMPTPRFNATIATYKDWLIVAGGASVVQKTSQGRNAQRRGPGFEAGHGRNGGMLSVCEVLNTQENQWHATMATPLPWSVMRSAVVGDVLYSMGGHIEGGIAADCIYSVSLKDLVGYSEKVESEIWRKIKIDCSVFSVPANINGYLHVCGGLGSQSIRRYIPQTEEWLVVGDLPQTLCKSAVTMTSAGELFVAGGCPTAGRQLNLVHLGILHTSVE